MVFKETTTCMCLTSMGGNYWDLKNTPIFCILCLIEHMFSIKNSSIWHIKLAASELFLSQWSFVGYVVFRLAHCYSIVTMQFSCILLCWHWPVQECMNFSPLWIQCMVVGVNLGWRNCTPNPLIIIWVWQRSMVSAHWVLPTIAELTMQGHNICMYYLGTAFVHWYNCAHFLQ